MVALYEYKIKNDNWTIDMIPIKWRAQVQAELDKEFSTA